MEINPYSMLEVTLDSSDQEPEQDPLAITFSDYATLPTVLTYGSTIIEQLNINRRMLLQVSKDELKYRKIIFTNPMLVLKRRLHCTICDVHIGCRSNLVADEITHPLLQVLACAGCVVKYKYIDFPISPEGKDIRCRWCASPASEDRMLRYCYKCPYAFCEKCISRNLLVESCRERIWQCCICNINKLWSPRAVLAALLNQVNDMRKSSMDISTLGDISTCCSSNKRTLMAAKNVRENYEQIIRFNEIDNNKITTTNNIYNNSVGNHHQHHHLNLPIGKRMVETANIKFRLFNLSTSLSKMNERINACAGAMNNYNTVEFIKNHLESLATMILKGNEDVLSSCKNLIAEFNSKIESNLLTNSDPQLSSSLARLNVVNANGGCVQAMSNLLTESPIVQSLTAISLQSITPSISTALPVIQIPQNQGNITVRNLSEEIVTHSKQPSNNQISCNGQTIAGAINSFLMTGSTVNNLTINESLNNPNDNEKILNGRSMKTNLSEPKVAEVNSSKTSVGRKPHSLTDENDSLSNNPNENNHIANAGPKGPSREKLKPKVAEVKSPKTNNIIKTSNVNNVKNKRIVRDNSSSKNLINSNKFRSNGYRSKRNDNNHNDLVEEGTRVLRKRNVTPYKNISNNLIEFEGVPIKKCFVKLQRISLPYPLV